MKTTILGIAIAVFFCLSASGEIYRYKCSCGATNVGAPYKTETAKEPLPDTSREVGRSIATTTKAFVCTNCQKQNCIVTKQVIGQRVVDSKVDENASQIWSSKHQPPIKPPK